MTFNSNVYGPASSVFYETYADGRKLRGNAGSTNRGEATNNSLTVAAEIR